jgi:phage baseplate assembly protein gpV
MAFVVQQALAKMQTATLVRVESCTNAGDLSPVGFVDVTPLVNQLDGQGNPTPHVTVYNLPYLRVQGGSNGIIVDPEKGDIGVAVFASRDISKVKSTKSQSNPGSYRQYSFADGMYLGGMLNGTPSQYIQFNAAGIRIHSPTQIKLDAPDIRLESNTVEIECKTFSMDATTSSTINTPTFTVNGATFINGPLEQSGGSSGGLGYAHFKGNLQIDGATNQIGSITTSSDVVASGTSLHSHTHSGVQPGGGNTGSPN